MNSKALLREARQALDSFECMRAIELCETVLREEPDHFTALLILGAAASVLANLSDLSKKALKALIRATEVKPDHEAPWKGLLQLYRHSAYRDPTWGLKAVNKVISFTLDAKALILLNMEKAEISYDWTLLARSLSEAGNEKVFFQAASSAAIEMIRRNPMGRIDLKLLKEIALLPEIEHSCRVYLFDEYFRRIEDSDVRTDFEAASAVLRESSQIALSMLIFMKSGVNVIPLQDLTKLFEGHGDESTVILLNKAKLYLLGDDIPKLESTCRKLLAAEPQNFEGWRMLLTGYLRAARYQAVETTSKAALKHCKSNVVDILTILGRALYEQERHREALIIFEKTETLGAPREHSTRLRSLIDSERAAEALKESLELKDKMWALKSRMALNENLDLTNAELNEVGMPTAASYLLYKKRFNDALKVASAALGQNPKDTEVLTLLGEIYLQSGHPENASKCLQQSFVLNRNSPRTGKSLSRTLRALKKHEDNRILLESITSDGTIHDGNHWAFAELGLHHLETETPSNAVVPLQKVATFKPSALHWELLAEAYASRNSLAAAALCLKKSIEMKTPREAFVTYRLACFTRDQEQYEEAIVLFESALQLDSKLIICAHDLGQCCLRLAAIRLNEVLLEPASQLLSKALSNASNSICSGRSDLVSLWNLLGDVLLKAKLHNLKIQAPADMKSRTLLGLSEGDTGISDMQLVTLAENCYLRCMSLNSNLAGVWHNLALVYVYKQQFDRGITCLKRAIKLDASSPDLWNALGVVSIRAKCSLRACQSALIRALILNPDHAPSWANLGFLYIKNNLLKEANQCFSRAQAADPLYVECWLGQATLAAAVGHFDACDLYRHSNVVKPTTHAIISNLAMQGEATEELLNACERSLHCAKGHPACAATGYVLLSHGLTVEARRVLSRCQSPECKLMCAQALLREENFEQGSTLVEDLSAKEKQALSAFMVFKSGRHDQAINLVPNLKDIIHSTESLQERKKNLQNKLRQDPRQEDAWRRLSECLLEEGKFETSLRVTDFIQNSYRREHLRVVVIAALMAGRKRTAYRAASKLVKQFPDRKEHWVLLRWASLSTEKRSVEVPYEESSAGFWNELSNNVKSLDSCLRRGQGSPFAPAEPNRGAQICSKLLAQLSEKKIDKAFLSKATSLLKADHRSEAGLFLTGVWAIANDSKDLYSRCLKGLPDLSSLKKLLEDQHAAFENRPQIKSDFD